MRFDEYCPTNWPTGRLLVFSALDGPTDYEGGLVARTSRDPLGITITMPGECFVEFSTETPEAKDVVFSSDFFFCGQGGCRARGVVLDAHHLLLEGRDLRCRNGDDRVSVLQEGTRLLVGSAAHFEPSLIRCDIEKALQARQRWLKALELPSPDSTRARQTMFTALSIMKGQICSPSGAIRHHWSTPDRWPHRNMWLWDSAFHAIGWRHLDPALAREMLEAVLDVQQSDGFIPLSASPRGVESPFTQPPILAFGVGEVFAMGQDERWLLSVYPRLSAYVSWDLAHRDVDGGGLCEWKIEDSLICRSGESGMDNSPRFDQAVPLDAVDFNSFLALECETLARFATILGRPDEAAEWRGRHGRLCRLINERLWSEEWGFYCDYDLVAGRLSPILASAGFLPLICGAVPKERAEKMLRHLRDPETFGTVFPVPSVAAKNREAYSKDMWRGPTWININWLIARGLSRYGFEDESQGLLTRTQAEIEGWCERFGTLFEYYDDRGGTPPPQLLRKGSCAPQTSPYFQVFHDYGWTACLYMDSLLSNRNGSPDAEATVLP